ncbi:Arc family DNA-binding protein [Pseudomonas sp. GD04087]|uniref:Arc family DNA-binding protein n=1 Tax=unclassified Pseudomonas TaxID=196821 RepID=UPI00244CA29B|nr:MULTISPECIES: Arc family DNA-binding protein [unclassified Pseudomonas]MDH0289765.1 Arc family DNA-binding protein [Pseudomonas sp. GD04087]MDH1049761.1 Arc family DNA-binding protein [Pseudomonas sp. GD03903]MDH2002833.1 Arc family DNA-binding protein [Pseudomonas sp. GD03691]
MSRDDPQFKLRMPIELRSQVDQAALASGRSLNAELVARLEASFLTATPGDSLVSAARARELMALAREGLPTIIRNRAIRAINRAVSLGHSVASVSLHDLSLAEGLSEIERSELALPLTQELEAEGYEVAWDGASAILIRF